MEIFLKSPYSRSSEIHDKYKCLRGNCLILEGEIAAGKTTLGKSLMRFLNKNGIITKFYIENINKKLLNYYLKDMQKRSVSFQIIVVRERINILKLALEDAKNGNFCIIDRGLLGDYSFAKMQRDKGFFSKEEWELYESLISMDHFDEPDCTLYLDCDPEITWNRLIKRGNKEEISSYSIDYFKNLKESYTETIKQFQLKNLIKLDWNDEKEIVGNELIEEDCIIILNLIKQKIIN